MIKKLSLKQKKQIGNMNRRLLCNIWFNLGFGNSAGKNNNLIVERAIEELKIILPDSNRVSALIEYVRSNRNELLSFKRKKPQKRTALPDGKPIKTGDTIKLSAIEKEVFYQSWDWRTLRMQAIKMHGAKCQCCGAGRESFDMTGNPVRIVVDHIKPISKFWDMRLTLSNLQILCEECNMGKGAWDETDWRCT